jgi:hypothetical protein
MKDIKLAYCYIKTSSTYEPMWEINTLIELDANEWKAINKKNKGRESRLNSFYMAVTALLLGLNPNIDRYTISKTKDESRRSRGGKKVISLKHYYAKETPREVIESFGLEWWKHGPKYNDLCNLLDLAERNIIKVDFKNKKAI